MALRITPVRSESECVIPESGLVSSPEAESPEPCSPNHDKNLCHTRRTGSALRAEKRCAEWQCAVRGQGGYVFDWPQVEYE